jgi:hypothetical protein
MIVMMASKPEKTSFSKSLTKGNTKAGRYSRFSKIGDQCANAESILAKQELHYDQRKETQ